MKQIISNQPQANNTTFTFDLGEMEAHLTERQVKRIIRLHRRVSKRVAENSRPILKLRSGNA